VAEVQDALYPLRLHPAASGLVRNALRSQPCGPPCRSARSPNAPVRLQQDRSSACLCRLTEASRAACLPGVLAAVLRPPAPWGPIPCRCTAPAARVDESARQAAGIHAPTDAAAQGSRPAWCSMSCCVAAADLCLGNGAKPTVSRPTQPPWCCQRQELVRPSWTCSLSLHRPSRRVLG